MEDDDAEYVTKEGRVLSDADIAELAAEAERGYDVERLAEPCADCQWSDRCPWCERR